MSLLDDVSIVVTPNGYKAGELYAVIPVPTEGAELGDTGTISNNAGGVITKTSSLNYNATSDGTSSTASKPKLDSFSLTVGKRYRITIAPSNQSGTINFDVNNDGTLLTENNDLTSNLEFDFTNGSNFRIVFDGTLTFNCDFVISLKELTSADMDVTRATAATRVDENGLVNYAEVVSDTELVTCGDFECAVPLDSWNVNGTATISSGKANINSPSGETAEIYQNNVLEIGKSYTLICDLDKTSGDTQFVNGGTFILANGSNNIFFTATQTRVFFKRGAGSVISSIDNVSVKEVTRDNVPRIDYTGGGCPHILAEPQRTNLIPYSSDFSGYSQGTGTITDNSTTSPDGTLNASVFNALVGVPNFYTRFTATVGLSYAQSIFLKKGTRNWVTFVKSGGSGFAAWFDLENGVIGTVASGFSANMENYGNGWYRCSVISNATITLPYFQVVVVDNNDSTTNSVAGTIFIWGTQAEQGSYATSYIPTSGSTVTRNQDIFTRDGIANLINSTEGVLFLEMAALANDGTSRAISIFQNGSNFIKFLYSATSNRVDFVAFSGR